MVKLVLLQERMVPLKMIIREKNMFDDRNRAHMAAGQLMDPVIGRDQLLQLKEEA